MTCDIVSHVLPLKLRFKFQHEGMELDRTLVNERGTQHLAELPLGIGRQQMREGQQPWLTAGSDGQCADHIESQQGQHGNVFLAQWLSVEVSPNESEPPQRAGTRPVCSQSGCSRSCIGSHQHILNGSATGNDQSDRSAKIVTELSEKFGDFRQENLICRNTPSIQTVQCGELAGP